MEKITSVFPMRDKNEAFAKSKGKRRDEGRNG